MRREECGGLRLDTYVKKCHLMDAQCTRDNAVVRAWRKTFVRLNFTTVDSGQDAGRSWGSMQVG